MSRRPADRAREALEVALQAEMAGMLAGEFVQEESEHIAGLNKWIAAHKGGAAHAGGPLRQLC